MPYEINKKIFTYSKKWTTYILIYYWKRKVYFTKYLFSLMAYMYYLLFNPNLT